jgi:predicted AAA+ superfamily ATPase
VVGTDLRELERVHEVSLIELLLEALPDRVGSPLSLQSLREDLHVSHDSVRRWLGILENLYLCFRIAPYGAPKIRAVKKEQKLYLWDWSRLADPGARFENLVACQLLKYCHFVEDAEGHRMELRFLRDTDRREVDFVVLRDKRPEMAVECRTGERQVSPHARYFRERTAIRRFFQVHLGSRDHGDAESDVRVLPFRTFVAELAMP